MIITRHVPNYKDLRENFGYTYNVLHRYRKCTPIKEGSKELIINFLLRYDHSFMHIINKDHNLVCTKACNILARYYAHYLDHPEWYDFKPEMVMQKAVYQTRGFLRRVEFINTGEVKLPEAVKSRFNKKKSLKMLPELIDLIEPYAAYIQEERRQYIRNMHYYKKENQIYIEDKDMYEKHSYTLSEDAVKWFKD